MLANASVLIASNESETTKDLVWCSIVGEGYSVSTVRLPQLFSKLEEEGPFSALVVDINGLTETEAEAIEKKFHPLHVVFISKDEVLETDTRRNVLIDKMTGYFGMPYLDGEEICFYRGGDQDGFKRAVAGAVRRTEASPTSEHIVVLLKRGECVQFLRPPGLSGYEYWFTKTHVRTTDQLERYLNGLSEYPGVHVYDEHKPTWIESLYKLHEGSFRVCVSIIKVTGFYHLP